MSDRSWNVDLWLNGFVLQNRFPPGVIASQTAARRAANVHNPYSPLCGVLYRCLGLEMVGTSAWPVPRWAALLPPPPPGLVHTRLLYARHC